MHRITYMVREREREREQEGEVPLGGDAAGYVDPSRRRWKSRRGTVDRLSRSLAKSDRACSRYYLGVARRAADEIDEAKRRAKLGKARVILVRAGGFHVAVAFQSRVAPLPHFTRKC